MRLDELLLGSLLLSLRRWLDASRGRMFATVVRPISMPSPVRKASRIFV
jgi:hypothetical protein